MGKQTQLDKKTERPNAWLIEYAKNNTSQFGEDGIIEKVLDIIPDSDQWCVEFGSWDGKKHSNTFNLITEKGFSAVLIEASKKKFVELVKNFGDSKKIVCINKFVGFGPEDNLDTILGETDIPKDFDLLSIDIDGNDYHVWEAVKSYTPKVITVEFNPTIPNEVEFVQEKNETVSQGSSIRALVKLGRSKGYELVCATLANAIFVDQKYYPLFGIQDNSVEALRKDKTFITHIFSGFDGTVFIRGYGKNPWYGIPFKESRLQLLPKWAVKRVGDKNPIRRRLAKHYRRFLREKKVAEDLSIP